MSLRNCASGDWFGDLIEVMAGTVGVALEIVIAGMVGQYGRIWYNPFTWSDAPEVTTLADGSPAVLPGPLSVRPAGRSGPPIIATSAVGVTNQTVSLRKALR